MPYCGSLTSYCSQVTGIYGSGQTNFPCTKCFVTKENNNIIDNTNFPLKYRNEREMKEIIKIIKECMITEKVSSKKACSASVFHSAYGVEVSFCIFGLFVINILLINIFAVPTLGIQVFCFRIGKCISRLACRDHASNRPR